MIEGRNLWLESNPSEWPQLCSWRGDTTPILPSRISEIVLKSLKLFNSVHKMVSLFRFWHVGERVVGFAWKNNWVLDVLRLCLQGKFNVKLRFRCSNPRVPCNQWGAETKGLRLLSVSSWRMLTKCGCSLLARECGFLGPCLVSSLKYLSFRFII